MSFASIKQSLFVPNSQLKKIYNSSTTCRNNLVLKQENDTFKTGQMERRSRALQTKLPY